MLQLRLRCIGDIPPVPGPMLPFVPHVADRQHHWGTFFRLCGQAHAPLRVGFVQGVGRVERRAVGAGFQRDRLADRAHARGQVNVRPTRLPIPMAALYLRAMAMRHAGLADLLRCDFCCATNCPLIATPSLLQIAPL